MEKFSGRIMSLILVVVVVITAYAAADGLLGDDETGIVISNSVLIIPAEESDGETDSEALIDAEPETLVETEYELISDAAEETATEAEPTIETDLAEELVSDVVPEGVADRVVEATDGGAVDAVAHTMVLNEEEQIELHAEINETIETASVAGDEDLTDEIPENSTDADIIENVNLEAEQIIEEMDTERQTADNEITVENSAFASATMDVLYIEKETKVYEQNDINSDVIAVLPEGCEVPLIEDMGEWLRIALSPEKEGYINKVEEETEGSHEEEITEEITDVIIEANTEEIVEETSLENDSQGETVIDTDPYVEASEETIALKTSSEEIIRDETVEGTASPVFEEGNIVNEEDRYISIRLNPDGLSEIIAEAKADEIEVFSVDGDWALVICGDKVGYVYANDLGLIADGKVTEKKVTIFTSRRSVMEEGETVYLTSVVEGMDGIDFTYNWQWNRGNGWEDIPGANSDTYEFSADSDTLSYSWRLRIHYDDDTVTQLDNE